MLETRQTRRGLLKAGIAVASVLSMPAIVSNRVLAQGGTRTINLQLGFLASGNQLGEVVAKRLGYFEEEKLNLVLQPGGPNMDGIAVVTSGRYEIGQISSSPSLMLAASQGLPIKSFAVNVQKHPYAFFSLPANPVRTPQDMVGKTIGIQATARVLLSALLKKHNIPESSVKIQVIGSQMTPLLTGQVHALTGWLSNTTALSVLGPDRIAMPLWDHGVQLYASAYYATDDTLRKDPEILAGFLRASGKGWAYAKANRDAAVDLLLKEFPNFVRDDEIAAANVMLERIFTPATAQGGWGVFDPAVWQSQIDLYDSLGQFSAGPPKLDAVITTRVLDATAAQRPKIG